MLYKTALRWLGLLSREGGAQVAARAGLDLICQDVDALCGYLMPCLTSVVQHFGAGARRTLRLRLTVHNKEDRKLEWLGLPRRVSRYCSGWPRSAAFFFFLRFSSGFVWRCVLLPLSCSPRLGEATCSYSLRLSKLTRLRGS